MKSYLDKINYGMRFGLDISEFDPGHIAECFEYNGKIGVRVDAKEVIPALYDKILLVELEGMFESSFYAIVGRREESVHNMRWGILSSQNQILVDLIYDNIFYFKKGPSTIRLKKDERYYCLSITKNIPLFEIDDYSYVSDFNCFNYFYHLPEIKKYIQKNNIEERKYAIVKKNDKCGIIMDNGIVLIEPEIFVTINGFKPIQEKGSMKLRALATTQRGYRVHIDIRGFFWGIIPPDYYEAIKVTDNRFIAQTKEKKWGIIDNKNKIICTFDYIDYFQNKESFFSSELNKVSAIFVTDNGMVLVDINSGKRISDLYDSIIWIENNTCCRIEKNGKFGIISENGDVVVSCIYNQIFRTVVNENGFQSNDAILDGIHGKIINGEFQPELVRQEVQKTNKRKKKIQQDIPTYERYAGSYAQDEMGYSDDDIDTIFDGDPNAYWNID